MKRLLISFIFCFLAIQAWGQTPVQLVVNQYKDVKGAKDFQVSGRMMNIARPFLKHYTIGPLAPSVNEMAMINMEKVRSEVRDDFEDYLKENLKTYVYVGKTDTPEGEVDAYLHFKSSDLVDELVIYNPEIYALYILIGDFHVSELQKIGKKD